MSISLSRATALRETLAGQVGALEAIILERNQAARLIAELATLFDSLPLNELTRKDLELNTPQYSATARYAERTVVMIGDRALTVDLLARAKRMHLAMAPPPKTPAVPIGIVIA